MLRQRLSLLSRHAALGAGLFVLANGVGEFVRPGFSTVRDWVSIALPGAGGAVFAVVLGGILVWHGLFRRFGDARPVATAFLVATAGAAGWDAARFYGALVARSIHTPAVIPASLPLALALLCIAVAVLREGEGEGVAPRGRHGPALATAGAVLVAIPLVRVFTFGVTRYERQADVAVVLGARAYADGTPSLALADRVDEAVRAYRHGLVRRLIMSGGIDAGGGVSEARVMHDRAVRAGVPPDAIELDEGGANTALTARNVARLVPPGTRVLLVSHYFHLPRTALLFRRQGFEVFTLPARMSRHLVQEPWFVAREVPAFYVAWLTG